MLNTQSLIKPDKPIIARKYLTGVVRSSHLIEIVKLFNQIPDLDDILNRWGLVELDQTHAVLVFIMKIASTDEKTNT